MLFNIRGYFEISVFEITRISYITFLVAAVLPLSDVKIIVVKILLFDN